MKKLRCQDTSGNVTIVDVHYPEQLIAKDVTDIHTGDTDYLVCFCEEGKETEVIRFKDKNDRDYQLNLNKEYIMSQVGVWLEFQPRPIFKRS